MPKTRITKEDILQAAFAITREQGIEAATAKSIAARLHCSTQPIYWVFDTMDNLRKSIVEMVTEYYFDYVAKPMEGVPPNKATGLAYIHFAKEEPKLFQLLFMSYQENAPDFSYHKMKPGDDWILQRMVDATHFNDDDLARMYTNLWIFSHGIATMIATGSAVFSEESISEMLSDMFYGMKWRIANKEETKNE